MNPENKTQEKLIFKLLPTNKMLSDHVVNELEIAFLVYEEIIQSYTPSLVFYEFFRWI